MATSYKSLIQETFSDVHTLTPEKIMFLVDETMRYFQQMQERLTSTEPAVREQLMKESLELREVLEKQMASFCDATGMDPAQLSALGSSASQLNPAERQLIDDIKAKFNSLRPKSDNKTSKRRKRLKIVS